MCGVGAAGDRAGQLGPCGGQQGQQLAHRDRHGAEQCEAMVARARNFVLGYCAQIVDELQVPPFWDILKDKKGELSHRMHGWGGHGRG